MEMNEGHRANHEFHAQDTGGWSHCQNPLRRRNLADSMRTAVSLLVLALVLALVHHLTAGASLVARAALGLGVLLVASELTGRLALRWRLPRVSGFVAAGLLLRPDWLGALRADEVDALRFVGDGALALFALRAGLAWRNEEDRAVSGLGRFFASSIVVPFAVTAGVIYSVHPWFPLTVHQPSRDALAVALVLGAFTVAAAPALAVATLTDAPGGAFGGALLRLNTLRDVAAVLLFSATLVLARPLASAGALQPDAVAVPLVALGASALVGGLLAWLVGRFRRVLGSDPGVFALGVAFGAAAAAFLGPAEVTLAALVAGVVLARFDAETAVLLRSRFDAYGGALAAGAFALLGARLDAAALLELWPWLLLLAGLRAVALYWGGRWAARGPVAESLARSGWLGLVPQAGVGLLLAAAGRRAFPEWGVSFESLAVALVALHAVVGPICLRWALARWPTLTEGVSGGQ
jgi:Kef-type K+ transport system membrane component KefB